MKPLTGAKITFHKAALSHFNDGQKKALYVFAHILNRTKLLEAQVFGHWRSANDPGRSQIEREAAVFGVFEFLLLLAGELKEGWEAFQNCYYHSHLSRTLNSQLAQDIQQLLKRLPAHFTGTSITHRLRNDFSYHHSPDKILATVQLLEDDDPHVAYLFELENNYFDYATKLRIAAVAESLGLHDWRTVIQHLVTTVVGEVFRDFSCALNAILAKLVETVPHDHETITLPDVPNSDELAADYFFYVDPPTA